ncbi:zinc ABC transporter substrate-binding protein [Virgibacillus halophilus]|uniref:Zinc ABC transporter substrate-binding protein n=1 Tax=Tigheibacillus halophilus TaxID=361280 RepID=A0ABU5C9F8_9BACI|nr:zinc ABC transporter substrate-binding protein [Virgibacillus halophilus]
MLGLALLLSACGKGNEKGNEDGKKGADDGSLKVVTSFSILDNMVKEIGKEHLSVHNLVPIGTDPHEYEPLPEDIKKATDADLLFYNGLNLEGGDSGWFHKLTDSVKQSDEHIYQVMEGVEPKYLKGENGHESEINPHAFIDPNVGIKMAENIRDALMKADSDHKGDYDKNANDFIAKLKDIEKEYAEKFAEIPDEKRILITSERAFQYLADSYDIKEGYIWEIDTEENGSPEQIKSLVKFIKDNPVPALFVESNVDTRPMETVSKETGIDIYKDYIFSDEIGKKGKPGDTYIKYLEWNIDKLYNGMK